MKMITLINNDDKPCFGVISDENDYLRLSKKKSMKLTIGLWRRI